MFTFDGNLSGSKNYSGLVDSTDPLDIYKFNLSGSGNFKLAFSSFTNNAYLQIFDSKGESLYQSNTSGTNPETINIDIFGGGGRILSCYCSS